MVSVFKIDSGVDQMQRFCLRKVAFQLI